MSSLRGGHGDWTGAEARPVRAIVHKRPDVRTDPMCAGSMACPECDAPVALGPGAHAVTEALSCPFCGHAAPAREFLSLAVPTRPARVAVRVSRPPAARDGSGRRWPERG